MNQKKTKSQNTKHKIPNTNQGITLVALIITIIVLLILAMVSIRLVMNGGIIDRANNGVKIYKNSEVAEKIKLAYAEYLSSKYQTPIELSDAIEHSGLTGATVTGSDSTGWKVTYNGKVYPIEANGSVGEATEVGKVKFGNLILGIGDQVNYDPTLNAPVGTTTYTSYSKANASIDKNSGRTSGYRNDQSFDAAAYKNAGFKWRVLDVKKGKIRLIAETDVVPGNYGESATGYWLEGSTGYINGVNELNAICGIFGHGKGAESATSITVDDVNGITGFNPNSPKYGQGNWGEYGSKVTYTRGSGKELSSVATNGKIWSGSVTFTNYFADGSKILSTLEENTSTPQITSTAYSKDYIENAGEAGMLKPDGTFSIPYEILFGKSDHSYWIASECVLAYDSYVRWGIRFINRNTISYDTLYQSGGYGGGSPYGVRPIVTLSSNVNIQWNATANEWQIQ